MKRMLFILLMLILCQGLVGAQELPGDTQKAIEILPTVSVLPVGTLGKGAITIVEGTIDTKKYVVVHVLDADVLTAMEEMVMPEELGDQEQLGIYLMAKLDVDAIVLISVKTEDLYAVWVEKSCTNGMCSITTYPYEWRKN